MKKINIEEAETNFCDLVDLAAKGEEVIICQTDIPVARLVAIKTYKKKRKPGTWTGKVEIRKDFDALPESFMRHFKGE